MNDTYTTQLGPWEEYADEHILLLRKFSGEESIPVEFVHVIKDADDQSGVLFSHGVMFVGTIDREDEKTAEWLNELAQAYGYRDFEQRQKSTLRVMILQRFYLPARLQQIWTPWRSLP